MTNVIYGTKHDDVLTGTADKDDFHLGGGGEDSAQGLDGNDTFRMGASLDAGDTLDGGDGNDIIRLQGDYSAGVTLGATTFASIEKLVFASGFDYALTTDDGNVAAGQTLIVNTAAFGAGDSITFDGSAETDGAFQFAVGDGTQTLTGGAGDDTFAIKAVLTDNDHLHGGAGNDALTLNGDYGAGLTLTGDMLDSIDVMRLSGDHNYRLSTDDTLLSSGQTLTVNADALHSYDLFFFNGSAETDGAYVLRGGPGIDFLTGGAGADTFNLAAGGNDRASGGGGHDTFYMGGALTASDTIDGGDGNDHLVLDGDYTGGNALHLGPSTLTSIEALKLLPGNSYDLTTDDNTVAAGATLTVDASTLGSGDTLTFNGTAETDGYFAIAGGTGNDTFNLGTNFSASDSVDGGDGNDTLLLSGGLSDLFISSDILTSVEQLTLSGSNTFDFLVEQGVVPAGETMTVDASALTGSAYLEFIADWTIPDATANFHVIGSNNSDIIEGGPGADLIHTGFGNDVLEYSDVSQSTASHCDHIDDFNADNDYFVLYFGSVAFSLNHVSGSADDLFASMSTLVGSNLDDSNPCLVTVTGGALAGHTYLLVDDDFTTGYSPDNDFIVDLTGATNMADFTADKIHFF